jgi:hypothetical protein
MIPRHSLLAQLPPATGADMALFASMAREADRSLIRSAFAVASATPEQLPLAVAALRLAQHQAREVATIETGLVVSARHVRGEPANDVRAECTACYGDLSLPVAAGGCECVAPETPAEEDARLASYSDDDGGADQDEEGWS